MKIVVIIPTYNESESIRHTVEVLEQVFERTPEKDYNILVTDGNSPDGTGDIVMELARRYPNIELVVEEKKRGLGAAYRDAMDHAFKVSGADAVITFDADLSHDPDLIPQFVEKLESGYEFVCGTRYKKGGGIPPEWGLHRKLLSALGNMFVRTIYYGSGLSDFTSGYKAISKDLYFKIEDKIGRHNGYTFAIAGNLEPIRLNVKRTEIPYHFVDRKHGESKMGSEYIFNALSFVVKSRTEDFLASRFGKVFLAGGFGSVAQFATFGFVFKPLFEDLNLLSLSIESTYFGHEVHPAAMFALFLSIEAGVFTAFMINNYWAFSDHTLNGIMFWRRYLKNQFVVAGAIIIQLAIFQSLASLLGRSFIGDYIYQAVGILFGLIWNFYFYKRVIWKIK